MIELRGLSRQASLNVAQAFSVGQLGERHGPILLDTWKCSHVVIAIVTRDEPRKCAPRQAIHQLCEYRLSGVHGRPLPGKGSGKPPTISSRHHAKSPENHSVSSGSWRFVRGQPDSSGGTYVMKQGSRPRRTGMSHTFQVAGSTRTS